MTFWQGACISGLSALQLIDAKSAAQIQLLLICIEMLVASIIHIYIFPPDEWNEGYKRKKILLFKDVLALNDFANDVKQMISPRKTTLTNNTYNNKDEVVEINENTQLLINNSNNN